jgi:hypothetical protein
MSYPEDITPYVEDGRMHYQVKTSDVDGSGVRYAHGWSTSEPLVHEVEADPDRRLIFVLCLLFAIVGLILGWVTAPYGLVPT